MSSSGADGLSRRCLIAALAAMPMLPEVLTADAARAADAAPLPSWRDGPAKQAILDFLRTTTDPSSKDFVPLDERIAAFDQDGTLWVEQPIPTQVYFCLDRVPDLARRRPEVAGEEPFKTVLAEGRAAVARLTMEDLVKIIVATLTDVDVETYRVEAADWLARARDSRWNRLFTELTYLPQLELLSVLRANGFKTYIVTGGGQDFVRSYADRVYGIPREQVVGSALATQFRYDPDGKAFLTKEPKVLLNDDNAGKPEGIHLMIGRRPRFAFGNSKGDRQMLEYARGGDGARLAMIVLHDDAEREYAYGPALGLPAPKLGAFPQSLYDEAVKDGWIVVSMKNDWKRVFAFE